MLVVGLTGSIGSGKSTVAKMLKDYGFKIIDADEIVADLLKKPNEGYQEVVKFFGDEILDLNGEIDKAKVAKIVFNSAEKRNLLNSIIHPMVNKKILEILEENKNTKEVYVLEIPLLAEILNGKRPEALPYNMKKIIVVDCPKELCIDRLVKLRNMSKEDAEKRYSAQATREKRLSVADYVIDNGKDKKSLEAQVKKIANILRASLNSC